VPSRGVYVVILDHSGKRVYASAGAPAVAAPSPGLSTVQVGNGASDALYAEPVQDGRTVVVGSTLAEIDRNLRSLAETMALAGGALIVLSLLGGWWLGGRALAPVSRLAREADAIGSSELDRRLAGVEGDDELGTLARTLNRMLARVEESVRSQRAFVMGASHDLRTPLAALRTELELALLHPTDGPALRAAVEAAHADAVRLSDLANGLLRLAAAEPDGRRLDCEDVHLAQLIAGAAELVTASATARNVAIEVTAPDVVVHVDRPRLVQVITNLLANATLSAPPGSAIELAAELDLAEATRVLRVEVLDRGPGVPPDFRSTLFEPFARARPAGRRARPGHGRGGSSRPRGGDRVRRAPGRWRPLLVLGAGLTRLSPPSARSGCPRAAGSPKAPSHQPLMTCVSGCTEQQGGVDTWPRPRSPGLRQHLA
jgi:signal transduction histidine kinase